MSSQFCLSRTRRTKEWGRKSCSGWLFRLPEPGPTEQGETAAAAQDPGLLLLLLLTVQRCHRTVVSSFVCVCDGLGACGLGGGVQSAISLHYTNSTATAAIQGGGAMLFVSSHSPTHSASLLSLFIEELWNVAARGMQKGWFYYAFSISSCVSLLLVPGYSAGRTYVGTSLCCM